MRKRIEQPPELDAEDDEILDAVWDKMAYDSASNIIDNELDPNKAALLTDTNPSEAQREAGNYAKGKFNWNGLQISIENPRGSTRQGTRADGSTWQSTLGHHYGYIKGTVSEADGDHIDCFMGPNPDSDKVFVVDQIKPNGIFDEHKCLLGFDNFQDAKAGYLDNYPSDWKCGPITAMDIPEFKDWLEHGDSSRPYAS